MDTNVVQDTVQKNKYHVTVKDYEFDLYNHIFPIKNPNDTASSTTIMARQIIIIFFVSILPPKLYS